MKLILREVDAEEKKTQSERKELNNVGYTAAITNNCLLEEYRGGTRRRNQRGTDRLDEARVQIGSNPRLSELSD